MWLKIIGLIIQLIIGRILPAPARSVAVERDLMKELAVEIATFRANMTGETVAASEVSKIYSALPGFIDDLIKMIPPDLVKKAAGCAFTALLTWVTSRDVGKALTGFITCVSSGIVTPPGGGGGDNGGGGGNGDGGGDGGGGIDPEKPTFKDVKRCN